MKRNVIIAMLCALSSVAFSQRSHQIGDTMQYSLDSIYFAPDWVWDSWMALSEPLDDITNNRMGAYFLSDGAYTLGDGENCAMRFNYTDHPIRIVGLATCIVSRSKIMDTATMTHHYIDSTARQEYISIYDATPDGLRFLDRLPVTPRDPCRYVRLPRYLLDNCCRVYTQGQYDIFPIWETYFDKPFIMTDSFYVGGSNYSWWSLDYTPHSAGTTITYYPSIVTGFQDPTFCNSRYNKQCYVSSVDPDHPTYWYEDAIEYLLSFALYEEIETWNGSDTSCRCPSRLTLSYSNAEAGIMAFSWQPDSHHSSWQIGIAKAGTDFEQNATVTDVQSHNNVNLTGLQQGTTYQVRVRALCQNDTLQVYSPWSDSLVVTLRDTTQTILEPSDSGSPITLRPNPASTEVTIEGYEGEVQVVDLQGRVVDSFTNHSPLTTHHLPALPPGTYLVKCGTTVRKLVVQ